MRTIVEVKGVTFGDGKPKVCIPIVGSTKEEVLKEAYTLQNVSFDVVEIRIDFLEQVSEIEYVMEVLGEIRNILTQPILVTFRTKAEGGESAIPLSEYCKLYETILRSGVTDMIDIELFLGDDVVTKLVKVAKEAGVVVVMSNHDFDKTPEKEEIIGRLVRMQQLGADLPKIAVMPQTKRDVITLLEATLQMTEEHPQTPIITMSMDTLGVVSRIAGELTGSVMTFATKGRQSAPGQVPVEQMQSILELLHGREREA